MEGKYDPWDRLFSELDVDDVTFEMNFLQEVLEHRFLPQPGDTTRGGERLVLRHMGLRMSSWQAQIYRCTSIAMRQ